MIKAVIFDMFETLISHFNTPLYFGKEMAEDMGVPVDEFVSYWRATEDERTLGNISFDDVIRNGLRKYGSYSEDLVNLVVGKRTAIKEECFRRMHKDIVPMLSGLHEKGVKVALISNCFSEEAAVIKKSELYKYFDVAILSCEHGVKKPDEAIFKLCIEELGVNPSECLYVGDGGTHELEGARDAGMKQLQCTWYLKEGTMQPVGRLPEFEAVDMPLDVLDHIK